MPKPNTCQLRGETKKTWLLRHQCHPEKSPYRLLDWSVWFWLVPVDAQVYESSQRGWVVAYILVCLYEYDSVWCCWNLDEFGWECQWIISMHKIHQLGRSLLLYPQGYQGSIYLNWCRIIFWGSTEPKQLKPIAARSFWKYSFVRCHWSKICKKKYWANYYNSIIIPKPELREILGDSVYICICLVWPTGVKNFSRTLGSMYVFPADPKLDKQQFP